MWRASEQRLVFGWARGQQFNLPLRTVQVLFEGIALGAFVAGAGVQVFVEGLLYAVAFLFGDAEDAGSVRHRRPRSPPVPPQPPSATAGPGTSQAPSAPLSPGLVSGPSTTRDPAARR